MALVQGNELKPTSTCAKITIVLFNRISRIYTAQALYAAVVASAAVLILAHTVSSQSAEPPAFVFTAAGDYGLTSDAASTLEGIGHAGGKFHLALGDLSYGGAKSEKMVRFRDIQSRTQLSV